MGVDVPGFNSSTICFVVMMSWAPLKINCKDGRTLIDKQFIRIEARLFWVTMSSVVPHKICDWIFTVDSPLTLDF